MADMRTYKPELKELPREEQDVVNKWALVSDTETFKLIVEHLKTNFINDMLFPEDPSQEKASVQMNDQYFRGVLQGMDILYGFIHERAEGQRNASL